MNVLSSRDLVESHVDVAIVVSATGAVALKLITSTISVVFVIVPDPIGPGLVASLAHPGGNLTGILIERQLRSVPSLTVMR